MRALAIGFIAFTVLLLLTTPVLGLVAVWTHSDEWRGTTGVVFMTAFVGLLGSIPVMAYLTEGSDR
jgi:hypothetical protein